MEWWKQIPGYNGKYEASRDGKVRRVYPSGSTREMTPYRKTGQKHQKILRNRLFVKLTKDGDKGREVPMLKIMAETFLGEVPEGMVPYHKNSIVTDNHIQNIGFISRQELGRMTGDMSGRRAVIKIAPDGEEVEIYKSAREAARHEHCSYQTILDRCNGAVKNEFALTGYTYRFEDEDGRRQRGAKR